MLRIRLTFIFLNLFLLSCATSQNTYRRDDEPYERGVWHRIQLGQTLWRISKTYRVSLEEIKEANDIEDVFHIAEGTWIFIPRGEKLLYVQGNGVDTSEGNDMVDFIWPVEGEVVKTVGEYGNEFHYGIDIRTRGYEDIVATLDGTVVFSRTMRGYGTTIIIEHQNDFWSLYSMNIESLVREGQLIKKNEIVAKMNAGRTPDKSIFHYELFFRGKPVNPLYYLP